MFAALEALLRVDDEVAAALIAAQDMGDALEACRIGDGGVASGDHNEEVGFGKSVDIAFAHHLEVDIVAVNALEHTAHALEHEEGFAPRAESDGGTAATGKIGDAVEPEGKTELVLGIARHHNHKALQRIDLAACAENHEIMLLGFGDKRADNPAHKSVDNICLTVDTDHDIGGVILASAIDGARGDIYVSAKDCLQIVVGFGGDRRSLIEHLIAIRLLLLAADNLECIEAFGVVLRLDKIGELDKMADSLGVAYGDKYTGGAVDLVVLRTMHLASNAAGAALGDKRADKDSDKNHDDSAVEYRIVEDAIAYADSDSGKSSGSLAGGKAEDKVAFVAGEMGGPLGELSGEPFGGESDDAHHSSHTPSARALDKAAEVHLHADADKEERDEEGVADERDAHHKGRGGFDEAVQHQTGEESAENALKSGSLSEEGGDENHRQYI